MAGAHYGGVEGGVGGGVEGGVAGGGDVAAQIGERLVGEEIYGSMRGDVETGKHPSDIWL